MHCWQIVSNRGIDALEYAERQSPAPQAGQVKVRVRASSINYRDLSTVRDPESRNLAYPTVPNSDCAGEIIAIGAGVTGMHLGDRIASCFFQDWQNGPCSQQAMATALGGAIDGVLAEEVVLNASGVVSLPEHLSWVEAATLPCAAVTAWNALTGAGQVKAGDTVLLLGTGGVSIFALQLCQLLGVRTIITSSSDSKLVRARALGADHTINYTKQPDWVTAVLELTDGTGVDLCVEVGGAGTLPQSIEATRVAGTIALIGVLTRGQINPASVMRRSIRLQGIYVGSQRQFQDLLKAIALHQLHPVVDQVFPFGEARAAYHAMAAAAHFGKLVIEVP